MAGVTRQTLWRWRQDGKVPAGRKYRDKQVVFTSAESEQIREYAQRLEPIAVIQRHGSIDIKCVYSVRGEAIDDERHVQERGWCF